MLHASSSPSFSSRMAERSQVRCCHNDIRELICFTLCHAEGSVLGDANMLCQQQAGMEMWMHAVPGTNRGLLHSDIYAVRAIAWTWCLTHPVESALLFK